MIKIDTEKCTNCAICRDVCPGITFGVRSTNEHKEVFIRSSDFCIACGQCVAFCKPQAIAHPDLSYNDFEELGEIAIAPSSMKNLLLSRRSVRNYKESQVPEDFTDELIEVATHAGTGSNQQSVDFLLISDKELLQKLEHTIIQIWMGLLKPVGYRTLHPMLRMIYGPETTEVAIHYYDYLKRRREDNELEGLVFHNAPMLLLAHDIGKNAMGPINCAIAMRNVEIMALTMGLGTCWNGYLIYAANKKAKTINNLLGLDNSRRVWGALMIGYPRHRSKVKIPRREREVIRL